MLFQSTRPVRGATITPEQFAALLKVSIHAPRAGRDDSISYQARRGACFNPRAPCGARPPAALVWAYVGCFNPRAPCGARPIEAMSGISFGSFNPRAPCGARPRYRDGSAQIRVSIHAPRAGRDE
ncbi:hypothetical protein HMPREF9081_1902 [Centipeda periodontii DSM 2778]|uniref:Uncharacterized protein n=1 Tax=Centipeda periodontii DSM 2778 TaxID=888060 RepID=F5RNT1_9FIRM|nr:hypothetical protein HMPREF9081_1902 [Centipeda periodontii DSM 2778]